jgi:hypothetical protein
VSDLKVDGIIASTGTNTALTLQGKGTGKVDIGDGALSFPDADGSANQVISTMLQDNADAQIVLADDASTNHIGGAAGEGVGALVFLHCPGDSAVYPIISGHFIFLDNATRPVIGTVGGARLSAITLDRVQVLFSSGSIEVGRLTVWGLAHA